ncbi:MAG TPA: AAA family ATPase [Rhabdochlamydiaceae bacterium]|nr:AAA family ATPase [Rhabdochlamydiaceae bacterium]
MDGKLIEVSHQFLKVKNSPYRRYFIRKHQLTHRMSIILGQRGVGKTTTLVQLLLDETGGDRFDPRILYVQADHFALGNASLYEIAESFQMHGGKWLAIDEIHKYPNWSEELKSIYDTFPDLKLFVSGSSALEIYKGSHDLIRRSASYTMQGLSFREYLELTHGLILPSYSLDEICNNHQKIADGLIARLGNLKIIAEFNKYLKIGYYPYYFEINDPDAYKITLEQNFHMTIDSDLAAIYPHLAGSSEKKIKQLLIFIANAVPFTPNWQKIMEILEIGDLRTLKGYFSHLKDASLINSISKASQKLSKLESPNKVYLDNTNQLFAIATNDPEKGTVRETFFLTMLSLDHTVTLPNNGDFLINEKTLFEVGGKNKSFAQVASESHSFLALDDLEIGSGNKIPLWLFGFIY